jgi:hypothetical protein
VGVRLSTVELTRSPVEALWRVAPESRRAGNAYAYGDVAAAHHAYTISRRWTIAATVYFALVIIILIAAA